MQTRRHASDARDDDRSRRRARSAGARGADEAELGKAEGHPACAPALMVEKRCVVGLVTKRDETYPARKVPKGERIEPLARAPAEPPIAYRYAQVSER